MVKDQDEGDSSPCIEVQWMLSSVLKRREANTTTCRFEKKKPHFSAEKSYLLTWKFTKILNIIIGTSLIHQGHQKTPSCVFMDSIKKLV